MYGDVCWFLVSFCILNHWTFEESDLVTFFLEKGTKIAFAT